PVAEAMERGGRLAAKAAVSDEILDKCKPIAGAPDDCAAAVEENRSAGGTHVMLGLWGGGSLGQLRLFAEQGLPRVREPQRGFLGPWPRRRRDPGHRSTRGELVPAVGSGRGSRADGSPSVAVTAQQPTHWSGLFPSITVSVRVKGTGSRVKGSALKMPPPCGSKPGPVALGRLAVTTQGHAGLLNRDPSAAGRRKAACDEAEAPREAGRDEQIGGRHPQPARAAEVSGELGDTARSVAPPGTNSSS